MTESCSVCEKPLQVKEGIVSSTGVLVCSDVCKTRYLETLPHKGERQLTVYSRVTGYITPVSSWNKGKLQEYKDRRVYTMTEAMK